jgi:hypothetical protein
MFLLSVAVFYDDLVNELGVFSALQLHLTDVVGSLAIQLSKYDSLMTKGIAFVLWTVQLLFANSFLPLVPKAIVLL